ncbi:MAG: ATP-dependent acyl-CoA ligase [Gaiellales bacterium]
MTSLQLDAPERTLTHLLHRRADTIGAQLVVSCGAEERTYNDLRLAVARRAGTLRDLGIARGDRVAILSENRIEVIELWLACAWLGAIAVPINAAAKGAQLQHVLASAAPRLLAVEADRFESLADVAAPPELERLWSLDRGLHGSWAGLTAEELAPSGSVDEPERMSPRDPCAVLFTSGTTGPAKGVVCTHAHLYWWGFHTASVLGVTAADVLYTGLPLYHVNALNTVVQALITGSRAVIGPRFSASRFWPRLIESQATVTYILGTMATIVAGRDPSPEDRAHRVRVALAPATPAELHQVFRDRFGVRLVEGHGMTETNFAIGPRGDEQRPGTMGWVRNGFEAMVVDHDERELPAGSPGELVLRSHEREAFSPGYWRLPDETAHAWRNGWFHTGDRVVRDRDGAFTFVDRIKDAIRRRGENVSAWEVEQAVLTHPAVEAVAAIPVPSALGEDDVLVCVVIRSGATLDPVDLVRHCESRLAFFAVPRYVDVLDALPLTENGKVLKFALRERGVTPTTWDREAAGVELPRR